MLLFCIVSITAFGYSVVVFFVVVFVAFVVYVVRAVIFVAVGVDFVVPFADVCLSSFAMLRQTVNEASPDEKTPERKTIWPEHIGLMFGTLRTTLFLQQYHDHDCS